MTFAEACRACWARTRVRLPSGKTGLITEARDGGGVDAVVTVRYGNDVLDWVSLPAADVQAI